MSTCVHLSQRKSEALIVTRELCSLRSTTFSTPFTLELEGGSNLRMIVFWPHVCSNSRIVTLACELSFSCSCEAERRGQLSAALPAPRMLTSCK